MSQTASVIRIRSSRDVLATVPRLLGYQPRNSIVLLSLHERQGVSTMRLDLPPEGTELEEKRHATTISGMLCRVPGVRTVIVVGYCDGEFPAGRPPRDAFFERLRRRLELSGFRVHEVLCVTPHGWGRYGATDAGPFPLDELVAPALGDTSAEPADTIDDLFEVPPAGPIAQRAFELAVDRLWKQGDDGASRVALAESALADDVDDEELARLLCAVSCSDCRDVVLFTWAWGASRGEAVRQESERIARGEQPRDAELVGDLLGMGSAEAPSPQRVGRAIRVAERLVALAPDDLQHIPLTMLAWLHWSQGRGSIAGRFVDRARERDGRYGLAQLLQWALGQGMLPAWSYERLGSPS